MGSGIYYPAEAARLISIRPDRLRRWVNGYTYWRQETRRRRVPHPVPPVLSRLVAGGDLPVMDRTVALSFLELMELRVVRELVDDHGLSLQHVRQFAGTLKSEFATNYPFASRQVFVEGDRIFATMSRTNRDAVVASRGKEREQLSSAGVLRPYLVDVEFDDASFLARKWWPLGRNVPVLLDPKVSFGAPTIQGRRLRTAVVAGMVEASSEREAIAAFGLSPAEVKAAVRFEEQLKGLASAA